MSPIQKRTWDEAKKGQYDHLYDFETVVRQNESSLAYALMPPSVRQAGMVSFNAAEPLYPTAPVIREAVIKMAENGRFGFTIMDRAYQEAVIDWMKNVRNIKIESDWIVPTLGTIHSVAVAIRLFTKENENIIVTPPVYNRYEQAAERLNRGTVHCPLILKNNRYFMDFDAIEKAMARSDTHLFVFCNPHNPTGQIWNREELTKLAELSCRYHIYVFSDEIFAENSQKEMSPSYLSIPQASDHGIVATSLGKAFGTTGMNHANMLIPNKALCEAFSDRRTREHYGSMDPVAYECLLAAYSPEGFCWVKASNRVIRQNMDEVRRFFSARLPDVPVYGGEGGYMLWMDWRNRTRREADLMSFLNEKAFLDVDAGSHYGAPCFTRMSLACPHHCVTKAMRLLEKALDSFCLKDKETED